jgi:hypothetical protein
MKKRATKNKICFSRPLNLRNMQNIASLAIVNGIQLPIFIQLLPKQNCRKTTIDIKIQ